LAAKVTPEFKALKKVIDALEKIPPEKRGIVLRQAMDYFDKRKPAFTPVIETKKEKLK
jgi:hypothetical protein